MLRAYLPLYVTDQFGNGYVTLPVIKDGQLMAKFDDGTLLPVLKPAELLKQICTNPEAANCQLLITSSNWDETPELKIERWRFLIWHHQRSLFWIGSILFVGLFSIAFFAHSRL